MICSFITVILIFCVISGGTLYAEEDNGTTPYLSYEALKEILPFGAADNARRDGACMLIRQKKYRLIAVVCSYKSEHIPLIFINAGTKAEAIKIARDISGKIRCEYYIRSFERREPWVAIICPCRSESHRYTPNVLGLSVSGNNKPRLIGWQGKCLRVQIDYEQELGQRKKPGTIEIVSDISESLCSYAEFRSVKGNFSDERMSEFICERMSNVSPYMSSLNSRRLRDLKKQFVGYDILAYSVGNESCIIRKKRVCIAGSVDSVAAYLSPERLIAEFEFPEKVTQDVIDTETNKQPQTNLASEQSTTGKNEKLSKFRGDDKVGGGNSAGKPGETSHIRSDARTETLPGSVQEAISSYILYLNKL